MIGHILKERYEILEEIGNGGMATVYLAWCRFLKRNVAIKVLHQKVKEENEDILIQEAKAIARVSHANIVQIYDIFEEDGQTFIVMEYVRGQTLKDMIKDAKGPIEQKKLLSIGLKLAGALSHAHNNGVIHRDVKPENIIVDESGEPKLTDFGIAHVSNEENLPKDQIFASLRYASPEQLKGEEVDERSDIFSLGIVLYEMATGEMPFPDASPATAAYRKIREPIPPVSFVNPKVPEELEHIISKTLFISPRQRYQSMAELHGELQKLEEVSAIPPYVKQPSQPQPKSKIKKKSVWPLVYGIVAGLLVSAVILLLIMSSYAEPGMVKVPELTGMSWQEAQVKLNAVGLYAEVSDLQYSDQAEGQVIGQLEKKDSFIAHGETIHLVVSKGKELPPMPDLYAIDIEEARVLITPLELKVKIVEDFSDDVAKGKIFAQSIPVGQGVEKGSDLIISISKGPKQEMTQMPDVAGYLLEEAILLLNNANIIVYDVGKEHSSSVPENQIISQSVAADTMVPKGTKVRLVVSLGDVPKVEQPPLPEKPDPKPEEPPEDPTPMREIIVTVDTEPLENDSFEVTIKDQDGKVYYSRTHNKSEGSIIALEPVEMPLGSKYGLYIDGNYVKGGTVQ